MNLLKQPVKKRLDQNPKTTFRRETSLKGWTKTTKHKTTHTKHFRKGSGETWVSPLGRGLGKPGFPL